MYLAKVHGTVVIKRMPDTGGAHAPSCDSYEPPPELSGLSQVAGTAIQEDTETGLTTLKFDFSLTKVAGRAAPVPAGGDKDTVKTDDQANIAQYVKLSLAGGRIQPVVSVNGGMLVVRYPKIFAAGGGG